MNNIVFYYNTSKHNSYLAPMQEKQDKLEKTQTVIMKQVSDALTDIKEIQQQIIQPKQPSTSINVAYDNDNGGRIVDFTLEDKKMKVLEICSQARKIVGLSPIELEYTVCRVWQ